MRPVVLASTAVLVAQALGLEMTLSISDLSLHTTRESRSNIYRTIDHSDAPSRSVFLSLLSNGLYNFRQDYYECEGIAESQAAAMMAAYFGDAAQRRLVFPLPLVTRNRSLWLAIRGAIEEYQPEDLEIDSSNCLAMDDEETVLLDTADYAPLRRLLGALEVHFERCLSHATALCAFVAGVPNTWELLEEPSRYTEDLNNLWSASSNASANHYLYMIALASEAYEYSDSREVLTGLLVEATSRHASKASATEWEGQLVNVLWEFVSLGMFEEGHYHFLLGAVKSLLGDCGASRKALWHQRVFLILLRHHGNAAVHHSGNLERLCFIQETFEGLIMSHAIEDLAPAFMEDILEVALDDLKIGLIDRARTPDELLKKRLVQLDYIMPYHGCYWGGFDQHVMAWVQTLGPTLSLRMDQASYTVDEAIEWLADGWGDEETVRSLYTYPSHYRPITLIREGEDGLHPGGPASSTTIEQLFERLTKLLASHELMVAGALWEPLGGARERVFWIAVARVVASNLLYRGVVGMPISAEAWEAIYSGGAAREASESPATAIALLGKIFHGLGLLEKVPLPLLLDHVRSSIDCPAAT